MKPLICVKIMLWTVYSKSVRPYKISALTFKELTDINQIIKNLPANAGDIRDTVSISGLGRSPEGGHSNLLQYFCLENPHREEPSRLQSIGLHRVGHN